MKILTRWVTASLDFYRAKTALYAIAALMGIAFAVWIPFDYIAQGGEVSGVLLLFYWALGKTARVGAAPGDKPATISHAAQPLAPPVGVVDCPRGGERRRFGRCGGGGCW